jgi:epoxide hydrolase-like predicted phosphatase
VTPTVPDDHPPADVTRPSGTVRGVIFDWGGVLTASLDGAMSRWADDDGVDYTQFQAVLAEWFGPLPLAAGTGMAGYEQGADRLPDRDSPVHRLERGEIDTADFERILSRELASRGSPVPADGLLDRMLAGLVDLDMRMLALIRRLGRAGIATAMLSNSWGNHYPDLLRNGLFDAVVISGEVGMRKPEERIFALTADRLGLPADSCVMVDDVAANVAGAVTAGMIGVQHRSYSETVGELEILLGLGLDPGHGLDAGSDAGTEPGTAG